MSILKVGMYASQLTAHGGKNYITFSSDNPFSISFTAKRWDGVLEYSTDAQNWTEWDGSTISSVDNVLYLRGTGNAVITNGTTAAHAMTIASPSNSGVSCTGNIMTLLDHASPETAVMGVYCFAHMFRGCTSLTTAPELPATTLTERCYVSMFRNCTSLTTAPELPATTLADICYYEMFYGCTSLTTAPELPATTLVYNCYGYMFYGCTSLTTAPELPATTLANYCYIYMFRACTDLTTAPELPATTLAINCYDAMFYGCTSIKISTTQTGIYQKPWRIPTEGTGTTAASWNKDMLGQTGGTFTSPPAINTTYYQAD